jgi:hypothetical protein
MWAICIVVVVLVWIVNLAVRFAHPALTETELFLRLWHLDLVAVLAALWIVRRMRHTP